MLEVYKRKHKIMDNKLSKALVIAGMLSAFSLTASNAREIINADWSTDTGTSDSTFEGNGGAIFSDGNFTLDANAGSVFENNSVTGNTSYGGAIYINGSTLNINGTSSDNVQFKTNHAQYGGAIYAEASNIAGSNVLIQGNSANNHGGGLYIGQNSTITSLTDSVIKGNTATSSGGGLALEYNSTATITGSQVSENNAIWGGGITVEHDSNLTLNNVNISTNTANNGGGIYNTSNSQLTVNGGTFSGNEAQQGSAIYNADSASATINGGTTFSANKGAGATVHNASEMTFDTSNGKDIVFENNTTASSIGMNAGTLNIKGSGNVIFNDAKAFTGNGTITQASGTTTFNGSDASDFSGNFVQNAGTTNFLDGSTLFSNYTIKSGTLNIKGGSTGNISAYSQTGGILNLADAGSSLTINNAASNISSGTVNIGSGSTLNLNNNSKISGGTTTVDGTLNIASAGQISGGTTNIQNGGALNVNNGSITAGSVSVKNGGELNIASGGVVGGTSNTTIESGAVENLNGGTINGGTTTVNGTLNITNNGHITAGTTNVQDGGVLNLTNGSITGGKTTIKNGSSIAVAANGEIGGSANTIIESGADGTINGGKISGGTTTIGGTLAIENGGQITGGTTTIQNGGALNLNNGTISNGTTTVQNGGELNIKGSITGGTTSTAGTLNINGGTISGGNHTISGSLNITNGGEISGSANTTLKTGSTAEINNGTLNSTGKTVIETGSNLTLSNGSDATLHNGDSWLGNITNNNSTLNLNNITHNTTGGNYNQTNGTLNLNGSNLTLSTNGSISNGTVNLNSSSTGSSLTVANGGNISDSTVNVSENSQLTVNSGSTVSGNELNINGSANINGGTLTNNDTTVEGTLDITNGGSITSGNTTVQNGGALNVNNGSITGGTTTVKDGSSITIAADGEIGGSANTTIESGANAFVNGGTIDSTGKTTIADGGTLTMTNGANVTLHDGDDWSGDIVNNNSNLTLNDIIHDTVSGGGYSQTGGTLNLNDSSLTLSSNGTITNGVVNLNESSADKGSTLTVANGGSIANGTINVSENSSFVVQEGGVVSGGSVNMKGDNSLDGGEISGGKHTVEGALDIENGGTISGGTTTVQNGGALNLNNGSITGGTTTIKNGSSITVAADGEIGGNANTIIEQGGTGTVNGGTISGGTTTINGTLDINNGGKVTGGNTVVQNGGAYNINNGSVTGGNTTIKTGSSVTIGADGSIGGNANTAIQSGANAYVNGGTIDSTGKTTIAASGTLTMTDGADVTLHQGDDWKGNIINTDSSLTLNDMIHNTTSGGYTQNSGSLTLNNSNLTIGTGSSISGGKIDLNDSDLILTNGSITGGNINVGNGSDDSSFTIGNGGNLADGTVTVGKGSDFIVDTNGTVSGGKVTITDSDSTTEIKGTVEEKADFDITNNVIINGGTLNINSQNGDLAGDSWTGKITLTNNGTLNFNGIDNDENGSFYGDKGNLNILSETLTIKGDSYISSEVKTAIGADAVLNIAAGDGSDKGGSVILNSNTDWQGRVENNGGKLTLNNVNKGTNEEAVFVQTQGETIINGSFDLNNDSDSIEGGKLNISSNSVLNQSAGSIKSEAEIYIADNSELNISGGSTVLNGSGTGADVWEGKINLTQDGTLDLNSITDHGKLVTDGGTLNIAGSNLLISDGSSIGKDTVVDFAADSTMEIKDNGQVSFDDAEWKGEVTLGENGTLNYSGTSNGALKADAGNLNTESGSILSITAGNYIKEEVTANIQGQLNISGTDADNIGEVSLSNGDTLNGNTNIGNYGVLNLGDNVQMSAEDQTIEFAGANSTMNILTDNNLVLNAELKGADGQINKEGAGNILFNGSTGNYKGDLTINNSGNLTFTDEDGFGGSLIFGDIEGKKIGIIADTVQGTTNLDIDAEITYSTYRDVDLILGKEVSVSKGQINAVAKEGQDVIFEEGAKATDGGTITASGANVIFNKDISVSDTIRNSASIHVTADDKISLENFDANLGAGYFGAKETTFKNINLVDSDLYITKNGFTTDTLNISGASSLNLMNGDISISNLGNVTMADENSVANVSIDISARPWTSDSFLISDISQPAKFNIDSFQFIEKCPIDRHIQLDLFKSENADLSNVLFGSTAKEVFTPIGWYGLFPNAAKPGVYTASLTKYNPQVFRGQVATLASYQNQLVVNNVLFDHMQEVNLQYLTQQNPNKYAAAYPQFAPYQYNRKDGGLWFKAFGTFERLSMTEGLNVNNNFYGGLVGADFPAVELKKGWTVLPTAYIAYTGGHQNYSHMSMWQNGGQAGGMATFVKNDFLGSVLAYGGGYSNSMNVRGFTDDTANWFAGTAVKAAYNFHPSRHFVIQPTVLASYTHFGKQRWRTDFGDMLMRTNMLDGVNVAPGVNFIYGRETWSVYATFQYFYNIMSTSSGQAGNVNLPGVRMRHGFLEYGIGATKTWKDRFSTYAQLVFRNGGRTGIGVQGGITFRF